MPAQNVKRNLTAVPIADGKGSRRLLGEDEARVAQTPSDYKEIMIGSKGGTEDA